MCGHCVRAYAGCAAGDAQSTGTRAQPAAAAAAAVAAAPVAAVGTISSLPGYVWLLLDLHSCTGLVAHVPTDGQLGLGGRLWFWYLAIYVTLPYIYKVYKRSKVILTLFM